MTHRVLVTGAQGFMGRYLVAHLLSMDSSIQVLGIGRSTRIEDGFTHPVQWGHARVRAPLPRSLQETLDSPRYHYASIDVQRQPELTAVLREFRPELIYHMASGLRDAAPDHLFRTNAEGTIALIEAVREAGIPTPRLVLGSTGFLYGRPPAGALPIHETTPCVPIDHYGVSKLASEHASRILAERYGIPILWARIFNLVGPGQEERHFCGRMTSQAAAIAEGVLPPQVEIEPLTATRDFLDVRDAAVALELLGRKGVPGTAYNVAAGIESPIQEVFHRILALAGLDQKVEIVQRPARPADIPRYVADIGRLSTLGFRPARPLDDSLADLLEWYRRDVREAAAPARRTTRTSSMSLSVQGDLRFHYPVEIEPGLLRNLPERLKGMFPSARMVVLTDSRVQGLYADEFLHRLRAQGVRADLVVIPEGERSKSAEQHAAIIERLYALKFDRRALLINLGGGLVTDVGGFVASSYMRGVAYINVPTTLLGQHDAAVGGKVAVNMPWAKNFVGAFYHPRAVFCDPATLVTLERRELAAGIAEAFKVAIIAEPDLFTLLEEEREAILDRRDPEVLGEVVGRATAGKVALLAPDPYESNLRRALNLGHTFGHALEVQTGYELLLHGEAVGFGLAVATAVARRRGVCRGDTAERIYRALWAYGLPPRVDRSQLDGTCSHLEEIRLVRANALNFVLPKEIGAVEIVPEVSNAEIVAALDEIAAHPVVGACVG